MIEHPARGGREAERRENPLVVAAKRLALAVEKLEPDDRYARTPPQAYIVGGYVRDLMLGLDPKDADVEVFGVSPETLKELLLEMFGGTKDVGESFGIIKAPIGDGLELDVSVPRRESKEGKGHAGFLVESDPSLSVVEAARRRDFTINALYLDPTTGAILDPFGGLADLKSRTLRVTDAERFQDDPLRVLRAVQFVARLGFAVESESMRLMREMVARGDLGELSRERVTEEFGKLLYKGKRPSEGMAFARGVGALDAIFSGAPIVNFDGWAAALDRAAALKGDRLVPLAAFFSGFSRETLAKAESALSFNKREMETVRALIAGATHKEAAPTNPANEARRTLKRAYPAVPETYANFLRALGRDGEADEFLSLVREHGLTTEPLLQGGDLVRELGIRPGVAIGQALRTIEGARDRGEISTREEALALARAETSRTKA